jgi:hypothetical protein
MLPANKTRSPGYFAAVSDPSLDFVLLVELPEDSGKAECSRFELQRCVRGDTKKLVAQATFVPGCVLCATPGEL